MKKIVLLLLLVAGPVNAQIVNIPDPAFKSAVLAASASDDQYEAVAIGFDYLPMTVDANASGEIEQSEADAVYTLNLKMRGISDLQGIQNFTNMRSLNANTNNLTAINVGGLQFLRYLNVNGNALTALDVTALPALDWLECGNNQLTALDVSQNVLMNGINCFGNQISALDVTNLPNLGRLSCRGNALTALDLTGSTALYYLDCGINTIGLLDFSNCPLLRELDTTGNPVGVMDVTMLTQLEKFRAGWNNLGTIDVSTLTNLKLLYLPGNNLTTLDCSNNPLLVDLYTFSNGMQTLYIKNGAIENNIDQGHIFTGNSLQYICADDVQIDAIAASLADAGLATTVVNSYCTFTPGGDYNTISGTITFDADDNGCDASDAHQSFIKIAIDDGDQTGATFTNSAGNYSFLTQAGTFTLAPDVENAAFFNFTPANATIHFPLVDNSVSVQDFCISANGVHPDLEIAIAALGQPRPGFETRYKIIYKNKGNQTLSGLASFQFSHPELQYISSTVAPDTQLPNSLGFNFTNIMPFESREIIVTLRTNTPADTPPVNAGDVLDFVAQVVATPGLDESPLDNICNLEQEVVNSYDPNDKTCLEGDYMDVAEIGNYLRYNINFENTGTSDAINVVVEDVIDPEMFDLSSLQVLNSSHPVQIILRGNIVEFIFENINLPPSATNAIGGHGNVLFKIKTLQTLQVGDMVTNTANIYFDYNHPIETNEARTTFALLSRHGFAVDDSVLVYPNPTREWADLKADSTIESIELFDVQGRILQYKGGDGKTSRIDLSQRAAGIYLIRVTTQKGSAVVKLVKE
ncbi:DUF7619 domain-containing protein [Flavobacterium caeni]|uniref:Conserved repeat domain-containing protein/Por secretion system C-terminal sorting domain-containing protein n=1 Tax=Flavobacterium caeni TaxID=490189 RepID=A0A1G5ANG2_9FLAO|nr:T9SS type A sorting domain-containing protein [Flavobacterium caeni]SCX79360.1 conserved repeat domain-containing protein/Por secretion system C-terminal sorting domain-containing protein [Flavobacterium caeni]